jgi:hypothetical protein
VNRGEAIAILKEIAANQAVAPNWVSLANRESDSYELHIKPETINSASLKLIVEKHDLTLKEVNGLFVIYKEHNGSQGP